MAIQGSRHFQESCVERIRELLSAHGYPGAFERQEDGLPRWVTSFSYRGKRHEIEIYEDGPVMLSGKQLFESYMPEEFMSADALLEGFSRRLDRYLAGGEWAAPDEPSFAESVGRFLKRLLH